LVASVSPISRAARSAAIRDRRTLAVRVPRVALSRSRAAPRPEAPMPRIASTTPKIESLSGMARSPGPRVCLTALPLAGLNVAFRMRDDTSGTSRLAAVDGIRAGIDPRGVWALGIWQDLHSRESAGTVLPFGD
jgi:hypothetical protein